MKKTKLLSTAIALLFVIVLGGLALTEHIAQAEVIYPMYTHTNKVDASLSIKGGKATCAGRITPKGSYSSKVTVQLQQKKDRTWSSIATWTDSSNSNWSEAGGTKVITKGYNYRVKVTGRVYDSNGKTLETVTSYSSVKSY